MEAGKSVFVWVRGDDAWIYEGCEMRAEKMRGSGERLTSWGAWGEECVCEDGER